MWHGGGTTKGSLNPRSELRERFDDDPENAAEAWQRTLNWFDAHLR